MKDLNERKVAALLSGSVDSSVAVALLVEQGVRPDLWYIQIGPTAIRRPTRPMAHRTTLRLRW